MTRGRPSRGGPDAGAPFDPFAGPPPRAGWEPERTEAGHAIVRTQFGPHFRDAADGLLYPYFGPDEAARLLLGPLRRRDEPIVAPADWDPLS